jgi:hypothetical protein
MRPVVTEHHIQGAYCAKCRKIVEPRVADALPGSTIGNHLVVLTAWLHYGLGNTLSQILSVLNYHLLIDRSGGQPALKKFFTEAFSGVRVTDFWAAYDKVVAGLRHKCLAHLFRELQKVLVRNKSPAWLAFSKKLKRLLHDTLRLKQSQDMPQEPYASRRASFDVRLEEILRKSWEDADACRLVKRLAKYQEALFTFLDQKDVPPDNNHAEREIRPAVIIRKNSLCNRSEDGADMQAVMMSIYRTLKLRNLDPLETIVVALRGYLLTGKLPPLPAPPTSLG